VAELHSQLDKYRTVAAVTFPATAADDEPTGKRKQRALGISAEPSSLTDIHDIVAASAPIRGMSSRTEADSIKKIVAEVVGYRHPKSPA